MRLRPLAFVVCCLFALPAGAQESESAAAEPTPSDDELEVIMVSAQKRTEREQDVPLSVTSIDGEDLDVFQASGADIRVLSARVPSLTLESSFGRVFPRAYIRGLGNTDFDLNASQPVSIILDDVVLENSITKAFPLFDLEQVEVLRGPQGTLFGRNTPAGIIKLTSRRPRFDAPQTRGHITYGSFNFFEAEVGSDAPILDQTLALRASALYRSRSGWVENQNPFLTDAPDLGGYEQLAGRLQLLYTPSDRFEALLTVKGHTLSSNTSRIFRANIIEPGTENFVDGFERDVVFHDGTGDQELDQWGTSLKLTYDAGEFSIVSITAYEVIEDFTSRGDIDGGYGAAFLDDPAAEENPPVFGPGFIPFPAESADAIPGLYQFTQELRVLSNDWDTFNFQGGLFVFREDFNIETFNFDTFSGALNGLATQSQVNTAFGVFASGTYDVTDQVRIGAGLRFTNDVKDYKARRTLSPVGAGALPRQTLNTGDDDSLTNSFLSWDATVRYQPNRQISLFARAATAFRAPTIQGRLLFGDTISVADSEDILSLEAGVKTALLNNRLRVDLTGYLYTLNNQQLTAVGGATNFNTLINVDQTAGSGFELEVDVLPVRGLLITGGVSLNTTEIQDDSVGIQGCGGGCTVFNEVVDASTTPATVSIDGNPLPHAPEWIANGLVRYDYALGAGDHGVYVVGDLAYRSRINFFLYRSAEFTDARLLEIGARLGYSYQNGLLDLAVFSRNLNNDLSRTGGIDFNNLTGFVNEPRTFGVTLSTRL